MKTLYLALLVIPALLGVANGLLGLGLLSEGDIRGVSAIGLSLITLGAVAYLTQEAINE